LEKDRGKDEGYGINGEKSPEDGRNGEENGKVGREGKGALPEVGQA